MADFNVLHVHHRGYFKPDTLEYVPMTPQPLKLTHPYVRWTNFSLENEKNWWRKSPGTTKECAATQSEQIMRRLGFEQDQFDGKTVIDVGFGPTGRLNWMQFGRLIGLDPLAQFYRELPWAQIGAYDEIHSVEAEQRVYQLEGVADAVISINCLDHGYDIAASIANIRSYLKPGGLFLLSMGVDIPYPADDGHPLRITHDWMTQFFLSSGWNVEKIASGRTVIDENGEWRHTYSGGPAFHWWSRKTDD